MIFEVINYAIVLINAKQF